MLPLGEPRPVAVVVGQLWQVREALRGLQELQAWTRRLVRLKLLLSDRCGQYPGRRYRSKRRRSNVPPPPSSSASPTSQGLSDFADAARGVRDKTTSIHEQLPPDSGGSAAPPSGNIGHSTD